MEEFGVLVVSSFQVWSELAKPKFIRRLLPNREADDDHATTQDGVDGSAINPRFMLG
jgi:hypothetical protein